LLARRARELKKEIANMAFRSSTRHSTIRESSYRPRLEVLEERCVPSFAADYDISFAGDGNTTTSVSTIQSNVAEVQMQSDGKILVTGFARSARASNDTDFALVRFNSDGTLDSGFGSAGKVITDFKGLDDAANAIAVQSDGKILLGGSGNVNVKGTTVTQFALARYNPNGTLDNSFGTKGKVLTDMGNNGGIGDMVLLSGGKILVSGAVGNHIALARYNSNGTLDTTFGAGGKVVTSIGIQTTQMAMQGDGKIVVVSSTSYTHGTNPNILTVRFNTDGTLDSTFGSGGMVTWDYVGDDDYGVGVAIQTDGKIVVTGTAFDPSVDDGLALLRYNTDGSLDPAFGTGGMVWRRAYGVSDIALDSSGRILIIGNKLLERYTSTGSSDTSFDSGGTGQVSVLYGDAGASTNSLTLQSDGKIVVAGNSLSGLNTNFGVARFLGTTATAPIAAPAATASRVAIDQLFSDMRAVSVLLNSDGTARKH
jgi:uncharacterized delta-60 repeat protein